MNGLKNRQKIGEANGMLNLPIVPTQVTLRENVGSLDDPRTPQVFTFCPRGQGIALNVHEWPQKINKK